MNGFAMDSLGNNFAICFLCPLLKTFVKPVEFILNLLLLIGKDLVKKLWYNLLLPIGLITKARNIVTKLTGASRSMGLQYTLTDTFDAFILFVLGWHDDIHGL